MVYAVAMGMRTRSELARVAARRQAKQECSVAQAALTIAKRDLATARKQCQLRAWEQTPETYELRRRVARAQSQLFAANLRRAAFDTQTGPEDSE